MPERKIRSFMRIPVPDSLVVQGSEPGFVIVSGLRAEDRNI